MWPASMQNLKQLRLVMSTDCMAEESRKNGELKVHFKSGHTPSLEVLELNLPCNMEVEMDPIPPLKSLILVSAGTLGLHKPICQAPMATLKHMHLQSGAAFPPDYRALLQESRVCARVMGRGEAS